MAKTPKKPAPQGAVKFRPFFTTKNGRKIWAKDYGHKSWPIK